MKGQSKKYPRGTVASAVMRAKFLRTLGRGAVGVVAGASGLGSGLLGASQASTAEGDVVEVWPSGLFPWDVDEVAAAVNGGVGPSGREYPGGGTVLLKATTALGVPTVFNFGDGTYPGGRATVEITQDVVILGEAMASIPAGLPSDPDRDAAFKPDRTVIYGGKRPFTCEPSNAVATRLVVRNLYFANPSLAAVQVRKPSGLEVSDCLIYDVKSDWTTTVPPFQVALGIEATGREAVAGSGAVTGMYRVMDNRIWRRPPQAGTAYNADTGIVVQIAEMVGEIRRNEITGFGFQGIGVDRNAELVVVADNLVIHCGYGATAVSGGIGVRGTTATILVEKNEIRGGEHGPSQWSKNGIGSASENVKISSNIVTGSVTLAGIRLTFFAPSPTTKVFAKNCTIYRNRLRNLTAQSSQVLVDEGCSGNVFSDNQYGGVTSAAVAGSVVKGLNNRLLKVRFWGEYLGYSQPCIWLTTTSTGNVVDQLKYGSPADWAMCDQVRDEGLGNTVVGIERCPRK